MNLKEKKFNCSVILTACIKPINMPFLVVFMHIWLKDSYLFGLKNIQNLKHLHGHLLITKDMDAL